VKYFDNNNIYLRFLWRETNTTFVDFSGGMQQSYVEDCQVCCQPNILYIQIDEDTLDIEINSESES
jgi:hypothetical protein